MNVTRLRPRQNGGQDYKAFSDFSKFIATASRCFSGESMERILSPETLEKASRCKNGYELLALLDSLKLEELAHTPLIPETPSGSEPGCVDVFKPDPELGVLLTTGKLPERAILEGKILLADIGSGGMGGGKKGKTLGEDVSEGASGGAQAGAVVGGVIGGLGGGSVGCAAGAVVGAAAGAVGGVVGGAAKWLLKD